MEVKLQENYGLYIDGKWVPASDGATLKVINPATGQIISNISEATESDVDKAVKAAQKAFESWKNTSLVERQNVLLKIADIIEENKEYLATVETMDNGKPIRETLAADIPLGADHFRYFAGAIRAEEGTANMLDQNTMNIIFFCKFK